MIFEDNDLLLSRRSGSSFTEQIIRPNSGSFILFDQNLLPTVVTTSSISVLSSSYALTASYSLNAGASTGGTNEILVKNNGASTISKGKVVKVIGGTSTGYSIVEPAIASNHDPLNKYQSDIIGIVRDNISSGATGYVVTKGYINGINTSGFSNGDIVYVSTTISGSITNIRPHAPKDIVKVGYITFSDTSNGGINIDVRRALGIEDISSFSSSLSTPNNAFLVWDGSQKMWVEKSQGLVLSGSLSGSNVDAGSLTAGTVVVQDSLTALNITSTNNIVSENDITVNRDLWVHRQIIASGSTAPFRVVSKVDGTNVLYVTGSRVGIGNKMDPAFTLEVNGSFAATSKFFVVDHQEMPGKRLVHATLEGPEHAVFIRGRSNSLEIDLPDYWAWLIDESSITVHLTAIGNPSVYYFKKFENNKIYIDVDRKVSMWNKLFKRDVVDFYYLINAERKDVDKLQTVI